MVKLFSVFEAMKVYLNPVGCGVLTFLPGFPTLFRLADVAYHLGICDIDFSLFYRLDRSVPRAYTRSKVGAYLI